MSVGAARELALDIAERIGGLGKVSVARFFSGAALIANGVQFGVVIRGSLYLRVDDMTRGVFEAMGAKPFHYAGGRSRTVTVATYYEAPAEILEDDETLGQWAAAAHRAAVAARQQGASKKKRPAAPRRGAGRARKKRRPSNSG